MTKKEIVVDQVLYGKEKAEVKSVRIKNYENETTMSIVAYVPPKTSNGQKEIMMV